MMTTIREMKINGETIEQDIQNIQIVFGPHHVLSIFQDENDELIIELIHTHHGLRFKVADDIPTEFEKGMNILENRFPENRVDNIVTLTMSGDREERIAEIIKEYSKNDVNREWLLNTQTDLDNVFKNSFHAIYQYTDDFDLSLWYLSFSQSFGGKTGPMLSKMKELCTNSDKQIISFKTDVPEKCPFNESKKEKIEQIFKIDCNQTADQIKKSINKCYNSAKFHQSDSWCNLKVYSSCPYRDECPVKKWHEIIKKYHLRYRKENQIFFYYDTLCLLNNHKIKSFDDLFSAIDKMTEDKNKKTVIIRTLLKQIRGIATKSLLFLQLENIYNNRNLDYSELIFVDRLALRVAERMKFPYYEKDLVEAIRTFGEKYKLNSRQIDFALWEMGSVCTSDGCGHGKNGKECIFKEVCNWQD